MTQLVIPMAGMGSRFREAGYSLSKPLLPIGKFRMFEVVISNLWHESITKVILVSRRGAISQADTLRMGRELARPVHNVELDYLSEGPAASVELTSSLLNPEEPLVIANSDQYLDASLEPFYESLALGTTHQILTMDASDARWSFVELDEQGFVSRVREKAVISNIATVGVYGFASAAQFLEGYGKMRLAQDRTNGEFYVAPIFNYFQKRSTRIVHLGPLGGVMHGLGVPADYESFLSEGPLEKACLIAEATLMSK